MVPSPETETKSGDSLYQRTVLLFWKIYFDVIPTVNVSASLSALYLTTNVNWFTMYMHKTLGLLKREDLKHIQFVQKEEGCLQR